MFFLAYVLSRITLVVGAYDHLYALDPPFNSTCLSELRGRSDMLSSFVDKATDQDPKPWFIGMNQLHYDIGRQKAENLCMWKQFEPDLDKCDDFRSVVACNESNLTLPHTILVSKKVGPPYWVLGQVQVEKRRYQVEISDPVLARHLSCGTMHLAFNDMFNPRGVTVESFFRFLQRQGRELMPIVKTREGSQALAIHLCRQHAAVEGFKLSINQTAKHLSTAMSATDSFEPDSAEGTVNSFKEGFAFILSKLVNKPLAKWTALDVHALHAHTCPGKAHAKWRTFEVDHGEATLPTQSAELEHVMKVYEEWLHWNSRNSCRTAIDVAIDAYLLLNSIHPFQDCNGRVSRLVMIAILLQNDIMPPFLVLSEDVRDLIHIQTDAYLGNRLSIRELITQKIYDATMSFREELYKVPNIDLRFEQ